MIFICIFYIGISVLRCLGVFGVPYDLCIDFNTSVLLSFPFYLGKITKASFCFTMALLFFFLGISTKTLLVNEGSSTQGVYYGYNTIKHSSYNVQSDLKEN